MRIVFMGTPEFAVPSLEKISGQGLVAVVTQPDRKAGRGLQSVPSPVKQWAMAHRVPVLQPEKLNSPEFIESLKSLQPDLFAVVAFRILPLSALSIPRWGAVNLHASLLPKYRGAAPIQWAIANGEKETGVTVFKIDEKMDTGKLIAQQKIPIGENDRAEEIHDRLMLLGANLFAKALEDIAHNRVTLISQENKEASLAPKLKKEDGKIDWSMPGDVIHNRIRGFYPYPGAFTCLEDGTRVCIVRSAYHSDGPSGSCGTLYEKHGKICAVAGKGTVEIMELRPECKRVMTSHDFARGCPLFQPGKKLISCP